MDSRPAPPGAGNSGGSGSGFSFFSHFSPFSVQQRQAAHEILPGLFLGSAVAARSASWLHQNGITHVLCLHNAAAGPQQLLQQLQMQLQQRREILKFNPETEPTKVQRQQQLLQQLQQQQLVQHLAVHPDRYVYCCCSILDAPQELMLPLVPFCLEFIDKALSNRNYRMHPPDEQQLAAAAAAAASGAPPANVRLMQSRRRNHCFIEKGTICSMLSSLEDEFIQPGAAAATAGDAAAAVAQASSSAAAAATAAAVGEPARKVVGGRVLVHCAKGISRSACILLAFLLFRKSLRLDDAIAFLSRKRPVYPNVGFQVQLQYLQDRLEEVRPALPHNIELDDQQQQHHHHHHHQKGAAAGAAAAHAFDATVSIEESEPDIFRRDPDAKSRLRAFVASCSGDLTEADLGRLITARIQRECEALETQVSVLYQKTPLLQQRTLWRPFGLFFENLRSYQLQQEETVLKKAEACAQKAAELKLVFAATLPGVSMADKVADEIKAWVSDCRAAAAAAAAAAKDKTRNSSPSADAPTGEMEAEDRQRYFLSEKDGDGGKHSKKAARCSQKRSRSRSNSSRSSSGTERNADGSISNGFNSSSSGNGLKQPQGALLPWQQSSHKRHRSTSKDKERERDRNRERQRHRGRSRDRSGDRDSSAERKRSRKMAKKKHKDKKKHSSLRLRLKTPKPKPKTYSSDSE